MSQAVLSTDFKDLKLFKRGKVRDVYEVASGLLIVATDRISAFDVIMPTPVTDKGKILNQIALFWFDFLQDIVPNHIIASDVKKYPVGLQKYSDQLDRRSMLVKKCRVAPFECVVRGYLSGSGWKEYKKNGSVCGIKLPAGLKESQKLPEAIFTPSTKADVGHDENVDFEYMKNKIGAEMAGKLRDLSLKVYGTAASYAEKKGIIIADTKFEFGILEENLILIDEVLTPDSSRFWPKDSYQPGGAPPSFDKQFLRDYLETLSWDKTPPGPVLPQEIVDKTRAKYLQAYRVLTGKEF